MNGSQIVFVVRRVRQSLWELLWNHALTAGTMAMSLFVFGAFVLLHENLQGLLKGWSDQIQIHAYLEPDLAAGDAQSLAKRIQGLPEVESVKYVSKEQAWSDFKASLGAQSGVLEGLPADVLPASFEITVRPDYRDPAVVTALAERLGRIDGVGVVDYPQEWVERLSLIVLGVQWAKWTFGGILFTATFFIIGSTVRLALLARREEVEIMQLVGASKGLIQAPFVIEGMLQGAFGGVVSLAGLWLAHFWLQHNLVSVLPLFGSAMQVRFLDPPSMALILAIGVSLGGIGSLFSLRRFLRTWRV